MGHKRKVLFLETGLTGGGSWHSLNSIIENREYLNVEIEVAVFIENQFTAQWSLLGLKIYKIFNENFVSPNSTRFKLLNKILKTFDFYNYSIFPNLSFYRYLYTREIKCLVKILCEGKFEMLITNVNPQRDFFGIIASAITKTPCISYIRSNRTIKLNKAHVQYMNGVVKKFICNSNYTLKHWETLGIQTDLMVVIYNLFNCDKPETCLGSIHEPFKKSDSKVFKIITVANFFDAKGHDFLIDAFVKVVKTKIHIRLYLVGDGLLLSNIKEKVEHLGLKDKVIFLGYRNDVIRLLRSSDLVVLPSKSEAFGRIVIEAFSQKKPVIGTKVGGIHELIIHNERGFLVNYGNADDLANAILELYHNDTLRNEFALNGYSFYSSLYKDKPQLKELKSVLEN